jgi:hypothetical protein
VTRQHAAAATRLQVVAVLRRNPTQTRHHYQHALTLYTDLGVPQADEIRAYLPALDNMSPDPGDGRPASCLQGRSLLGRQPYDKPVTAPDQPAPLSSLARPDRRGFPARKVVPLPPTA